MLGLELCECAIIEKSHQLFMSKKSVLTVDMQFAALKLYNIGHVYVRKCCVQFAV